MDRVAVSTGPTAHATLGPSSAARWLSCPGSVALCEHAPEQGSSPAAEEGTAAHALAEIALRWSGSRSLSPDEVEASTTEWVAQYADLYDRQEMARFLLTYERAVLSALRDAGDDAVLLLEQRHETGIPGVWGTADAVVLSPTHIHVLDLKYGRGVPVSAVANPQLRLYALGALRGLEGLVYDGRIAEVQMTIVQPRLGSITSETISRDELEEWAGWARARAEMTAVDGAPLTPSEKACRWCPAAGFCEALRAESLRVAFGDGSEPPVLGDAPEIGPAVVEALEQVPLVEQWVRSVKSLAESLASEDRLPGYHLEPGRGRRKVAHPDALIDALVMEGYTEDQVTTRDVLGITALTKIVGKKTLDALSGEGMPIQTQPGPKKLVKDAS